MTTLITPDEFNALTQPFRQRVFRLETLQVYRGSGEDEWTRLFQAGASAPPSDPEQDEWESLIRHHRRAGRLVQRVHVVVEPVTPYLRFELAWPYALSVAVDEDVRIIPVSGDDDWPPGVPHHDFWLYDDIRRFDAEYTDDGTWLGVVPVDDPAAVEAACRWRDAALALAQPWGLFMAGRPDLARRIPAA